MTENTREIRFMRPRQDTNGEGSRGGHIVGHTTSGKPIYGLSATKGTHQVKKPVAHNSIIRHLKSEGIQHSEERVRGIHPNNLHAVMEAMDQARASGLAMPKSLGVTKGAVGLKDPHTIAQVTFGEQRGKVGTRMLSLNGEHFKGDKTKKAEINPRGRRFTVSSHALGMMHHEMGHIQQAQHLSDAGHNHLVIKGQQNRGVVKKGTPEWKALKRDVSEYAMESAGEFVAEVHAGVAMGETFEEATMEKFYQLTGVPKKKWKFAVPREGQKN